MNLASHPLLGETDIIHLHWVAGLLSPAGISALANLGKPVVWTIHDLRPMTGGCHFPAGCLKFTSTCTGCPQIKWDPHLLSELQLADQKESLPVERFTIACPSKWIFDAAQSSALFGKSKLVQIPYAIDHHLFAPREKAECRQELGLPAEGTFILFAADNAGEKRKGFSFLLEALKQIQAEPKWRELAATHALGLICLGHAGPELQTLGLPVHPLGYINDDRKVTLAYGASDLFVLPSLEDNLPNTIMESISSGRPVVAFAAGGIPDLVQHGVNGFLAAPGDAKGLAEGIVQLAASPGLRTRFGAAGRELTLDRFKLQVQAQSYKTLYESLAPNPASLPVPSGKSSEPTARLRELLHRSLPPPALEHLFSREIEHRNLVREREAHIRTMMDQTEYIGHLKIKADENEKALKQLLQQRTVKTLRKLKLIKTPRP